MQTFLLLDSLFLKHRLSPDTSAAQGLKSEVAEMASFTISSSLPSLLRPSRPTSPPGTRVLPSVPLYLSRCFLSLERLTPLLYLQSDFCLLRPVSNVSTSAKPRLIPPRVKQCGHCFYHTMCTAELRVLLGYLFNMPASRSAFDFSDDRDSAFCTFVLRA